MPSFKDLFKNKDEDLETVSGAAVTEPEAERQQMELSNFQKMRALIMPEKRAELGVDLETLEQLKKDYYNKLAEGIGSTSGSMKFISDPRSVAAMKGAFNYAKAGQAEALIPKSAEKIAELGKAEFKAAAPASFSEAGREMLKRARAAKGDKQILDSIHREMLDSPVTNALDRQAFTDLLNKLGQKRF